MDNKNLDLLLDSLKLESLLKRLLEKTEKGELQWESTASRNTFLVVVKDSAITINRLYSATNNNYYEFAFRNEYGDVTDVVIISKYDNAAQLDKAEKIYDLAQKQSQRINETLDHLLEQLAA